MVSLSDLAYARNVGLIAQGALLGRRVARLWAEVPLNDLSAGFQSVAPRMVAVVSAAQLSAARGSESYLSAVDKHWGVSPRVDPIVPEAFAGVAGDGRALAPGMYGAVTHTKTLIGRGVAERVAFQSGATYLMMMVQGMFHDMARNADRVSSTGHKYTRYVRVVNGSACSRCAILAGKYSAEDAFLRHVSCFPAGVTVSGPSLNAATRRWYEGELVTFSTGRGQDLSLTGNHPVLTRRGWIPASLLMEGDEVFRSTRPEGATALKVPDHDQMPARIEDVWRSFSMSGLSRVPSTSEDFHGDGQDGEIDIVRPDRSLWDGVESLCFEHIDENPLSLGLMGDASFISQSASQHLDFGSASHSVGGLRTSGVPLALLDRRRGLAEQLGLAVGTTLNSGLFESERYYGAGDAILVSEEILARTREVSGSDFFGGKVDGTRWNAPDGAFAGDNVFGYASRGLDLLPRLSGQVEAERILNVRRVAFSGHVYSLDSSEGWHSANNYIVSNCQCGSVAIPSDGKAPKGLHDSPQSYFDSLSRTEQDRVFTKAGAEAIRQGADPVSVVNARRGAYGIGYSNGSKSAVGTVRSMERVTIGVRPNGDPVQVYATSARTAGARGVKSERVRLMPEDIFRFAGADDRLRSAFLRDAGYMEYKPSQYGDTAAALREIRELKAADRVLVDRATLARGNFTLG